MGIHPSTFSLHLKSLSARKDTAADFTQRLARILEVDATDFQQWLSAPSGDDFGTLPRILEQLEATFRPLNKSYINEILDVTRALHADDSYTLITCIAPLEYHDHQLADTIATAIRRGAQFRYVFPTSARPKSRRASEPFDIAGHLTNYLTPETINFANLVDQHDRVYLPRLAALGVTGQELSKRVHCRTSSDPFLVNPFTKFIHIRRLLPGAVDITVLVEARFGSFTHTDALKYWYPLPRVETQLIDLRVKELFG